jgi:hypothetical protein
VIGGGSDGGGGGGEGGGGSGSDRDDEGGGGTQTPQDALDYIYPRACCRSARTVAPLREQGPFGPPRSHIPQGGSVGGGAADHQQRWHWLPLVATRWRGGVRLVGGEQAIAGRRGRPGAESASTPGANKEGANEAGAYGPGDE